MTEQNYSVERIKGQVELLASVLIDKQLVLSTAESCTGGWIAKSLTDLAGSSAWFDTGFITYSNKAKQKLLNVSPALLALGGPGAVSEQTVLAMTQGAVSNSEAQVSVAVSGVAGPGGGSEEKPVGTVWIAWQWGSQSQALRYHFRGDRDEVRLGTVVEALEGLIKLLR